MTVETVPEPAAINITVKPPRESRGRILQLDVLRGIAILLVLGRHPAMPPETAGRLEGFARAWEKIGWMGVDLFFVLSGFLIGGLLFTELKEHGTLHVGRFLIRRIFKIWPGYFVLLLFLTTGLTIERWDLGKSLLPNWFHLQNYLGTPRLHTWSLAVEEHFYIVLPFLLLALRKRLHLLPAIALFVTGFCLVARMATASLGTPGFDAVVYPTHLRMDSLFFGVLLAYLTHYQPEALQPCIARRRLLFLAGVLLLVPTLWLGIESPFIQVFGLTFNYFGFGAILLAVLHTPMDNLLTRGLAFIGFYSYSIYLWHIDMARVPAKAVSMYVFSTPHKLVWLTATVYYVLLAIGMGIFMGRLIEFPALRLRDRLFPSLTRR